MKLKKLSLVLGMGTIMSAQVISPIIAQAETTEKDTETKDKNIDEKLSIDKSAIDSETTEEMILQHETTSKNVDIPLDELTDEESLTFFGMSSDMFLSAVEESFGEEVNPKLRYAQGVVGVIKSVSTGIIPGTVEAGGVDRGSTFILEINGEQVFGTCYQHDRDNPTQGSKMIAGSTFDGNTEVGKRLAKLLTDSQAGRLNNWQTALAAHAVVGKYEHSNPVYNLEAHKHYYAIEQIQTNPIITPYYNGSVATINGVQVSFSKKTLTMPIGRESDGWRYSDVTKVTLKDNQGNATIKSNGATIFVKSGSNWVNKGTSTTVSNNTEVRFGTQKTSKGTFSADITAQGPNKIPDFVQSFHAKEGKDFYQNVVFLRTKDSTDKDSLKGTFPASNGKVEVTKLNPQKYPLMGAEFQVIDASTNTVIDTVTTNAQGKVLTKDLPLGDYIIKETKAPKGYEIQTTPVNVSVKAGETSKVTVYNKSVPYNQIVILKLSETFGDRIKLSGTTFRMTGNPIGLDGNGNPVTKPVDITFTLDEFGEYTFTPEEKNQIIVGTYEIEEIASPNGYVKLKDKIVVEYTDPLQTELFLDIKNETQKGTFKLVKEGETINGVTQETEEILGKEVNKFTLGKAKLQGAEFDVFIKEDIKIPGTDKVFKAGTKVDHIVTDSNGEAISNGNGLSERVFSGDTGLEVGKYYVKETKAPNGHVVDTEAQYEVEIKANNEEAQKGEHISEVPVVSVFNKLQTVDLNLVKVGEKLTEFNQELNGFNTENVRLEGVVFGIYTDEDILGSDGSILLEKDSLVGVSKTDAEGLARFEDNFPFTKFYAKELETTEEHVLTDEKYPFEINAINDKPIRKLYVYQDGISDDNENELLTPIKNDLFRTRFQIKKLAEIGEHDKDGWTFNIEESPIVEGTEFELTTEEGIFVQDMVVGEDLTATSNEIPLGNYILKETKAPNKDYSLNEELYNLEWKVSVTKDGTSMVQIDDGVEVEGTEITVNNLQDNQIITLDGTLPITLEQGKYKFKINTEDENLDLSDNVLMEIISEDGSVLTELTVSDMDKEIEILEGQRVQLKEIEGSFSMYAIKYTEQLPTNEVKDTTPINLVEGSYTVGEDSITEGKHEITGTVGSVLVHTDSVTGEEIRVEITEENQTTEITTTTDSTILIDGEITMTPIVDSENINQFEITNYLKKGEFDFTKKDVATGENLEGAIIEIIGVTNDTLIEFESKKEGNRFTLVDGTYIFKETVAPDGYVLSTETGTFTIEDGKVTKAILHNVRPGKLKFSKTDVSTGKLLKGAEIQIKGKTNDTDIKFVTDGTEQTFELDEGTYEFSETLAPKGYQKTTEKGIFTIENGKVTKAKLHNKRVAETGNTMTKGIVPSVIGMSTLAVIGAYLFRRKNKFNK